MVELRTHGIPATDAPRARGREDSERTRIYLADDDSLLRRGLASLISGERDLEVCGETADCATAGREVRRLRPDVLIVEVSMEGSRGMDMIRSLKAFDSAIHVVVLSALDESVHALPVLKAGACAYVTKQALPASVINVIRRARVGDICVSECVASRIFDRVAGGRSVGLFSPAVMLSSRELEVFKAIGAGCSTQETAERLEVSIKTVETHRAHIMEKAGLSSNFDLLQMTARWSGAGVHGRSGSNGSEAGRVTPHSHRATERAGSSRPSRSVHHDSKPQTVSRCRRGGENDPHRVLLEA